MADAVGTVTTPQSVLDNVASKGLSIIAPFIRDYPELMYLGLDNPNRFDNGGKFMNKLTYAQKRALGFKKIGAIESDMTVGKNEVYWYEVGLFTETSEVVADVTAGTTFEIPAEDMKYFAAGDVIAIRPAIGSAGVAAQVEISSIDVANDTITVDTAVTVKEGDTIVYVYTTIEECEEITRGAADDEMTPVKSYFQRFGGSVEFKTCDINQKRLVLDAQEYVKSKFSTVANRSNSNFANAFYLGRNKAGSKSETQGLDHVVNGKETRDGAGTAIIDYSTLTALDTPRKRLFHLVKILNDANSAPVYKGNEVATMFINDTMVTQLTEDLMDYKDGLGGYELKENTIAFGLPKFTSPFFKNVEFIVSHTLNKLEPYRAVGYIMPKHLVTFKVPEFMSVDANGTLTRTMANGYSVLKLPQTSVECVKYQMLMIIANIFGGQTFPNTYKKIINY